MQRIFVVRHLAAAVLPSQTLSCVDIAADPMQLFAFASYQSGPTEIASVGR
jgi:hypothetical protein